MKRTILTILIVVLFLMGAISCQEQNQGATMKGNKKTSKYGVNKQYFPTNQWKTSTPEKQGVDSEMLYNLVKGIRDRKTEVDSLIIVRNGCIITEAYFQNNKKDDLHEIQSVTKSFTSALVGIAMKEGYIKNMNSRVLDCFPDKKIINVDSRKKEMTIRNLLTMSAGLEWDAYYTPGISNTTDEMYQSDDPVQYILDKPMTEEPGKSFLYNNGASHLLSSIVAKSIGNGSGGGFHKFAEDKLFKPLGITDYFWQSDGSGTPWGMACLYLKARDLAKFGYLYLMRGKWEGKQLIQEDWVDASTKKQIETNAFLSDGYGYQWWINSFGGYSARGIHGQYIIVMPKINMVVVFQSHFTDNDLVPLNMMEADIIPAVKSDGALPANNMMAKRLQTVCGN